MDLSILNDSQKEAVVTTEGPVMVMAGAGSGKTRVLTYRLAYLIDELGVNPTNILAVTFTNKAAKEMKDRISSLLEQDVSRMWISTFHSFCARFLRREIGVLNTYTNRFVIIDDDDSLKILKEEMKDKNFRFTPREVLGLISNVKNEESLPDLDSYERNEFEIIYRMYQDHLVKENLLDFDDLIMLTVKILETSIPVLERYSNMFSYIMIDEFQDTNRLQYKLVNLLASHNKNIFIVGDINQSIYSFRGARVENVNSFRKLYEPKIIKLEQNYRSTKEILEIANDVISKNTSFVNMQLFTDGPRGEKAKFYIGDSNYGELVYIVNEIKRLVRSGYQYKDIAILYRLNSLSLNFENEFIKANIPYVIYGGVGYFERKEVKDIIAYLRLLINHNDDFSFKRVVNVPKRKIGDKVIENLSMIASASNVSLYEAIPESGNRLLMSFRDVIENLTEDLHKLPLDSLIDAVLEKTNYLTMLQLANEEDRIDNVMELKSIMKDIMESYDGENVDKLSAFLMDLALRTDVDNVSEGDNKVKLMSFHQAKGLEYKVVFMVAMEQGIFPSFKSMGSSFEMEEERRVCYVGVTRAREKLYFTSAHVRRLYGKDNVAFPSEFIKDIKPEHLESSGYGIYNTSFSKPASTATSNFRSKTVVREAKGTGEIKIGDKIMHKVFGKGVIVNVEGKKITVAFSQEYGVKVLMSDHPSVTRI